VGSSPIDPASKNKELAEKVNSFFFGLDFGSHFTTPKDTELNRESDPGKDITAVD
jgi:hypothetical protein